MPPKPLTVFGSTVLSLMMQKGITQQVQLLRLLEKEGFKASQPAFSRWLYGQSVVNKDFPEAFARALRLSGEERERLAMAFTFGQNERITIEDL